MIIRTMTTMVTRMTMMMTMMKMMTMMMMKTKGGNKRKIENQKVAADERI